MKQIMRIVAGLLLAAALPGSVAQAQTNFFNIDSIQKIEITFTQANWDYRMDTAKLGSGGYLKAVGFKINGVAYDTVGVKYKGNSSYDSTFGKNPLNIKLDKYRSQTYAGLTNIKLANIYQDPSMIREPLSYAMLSRYMDCPRSNFAQVYINGAYMGLYTNDEAINKAFALNHLDTGYSSNVNSFISCSPAVAPTPLIKSNLKYISADSTAYMTRYELESNVGWNDLVHLCDTVTNYPTAVGNIMDMDKAIWMLAFNNVMVNMDSYSGLFAQNYYLYKDRTGHFNPIVWDMNMGLGGFVFKGTANGGTGTMGITDMQQLSPTLHATDTDWPLINDVMNNPMYKRMYIAHMRTITSEMLASGLYQTLAQHMQTVIDTAVQSDPHKFTTYAQFQGGLTTNTTINSHAIPGISTLVVARVAYLQSTAEFTAAPPVLSNIIQHSIGGGGIQITATITNVTAGGAAYVGYRTDTTIKFTRVQMYDDGLHGDGAANDNVFGGTVPATAYSGQYYLYAENANAGIFSPARAEHEFYRFGIPTGVSAVAVAVDAVVVYPNPVAAGTAVRLSQKSTGTLCDVYGRTVGTFAGVTEISTTSLAPGIYLLRTTNHPAVRIVVQ